MIINKYYINIFTLRYDIRVYKFHINQTKIRKSTIAIKTR
jgi:hypothetical protein